MRSFAQRARLELLVPLAAAIGLGACASAGWGGTASDGGVRLELRNDQSEDIRVYVARGSSTIPLAAVGSFDQRRIRISATLIGRTGSLQLVAVSLASGRTIRSERLSIRLGDMVVWHVNRPPTQSPIWIR